MSNPTIDHLLNQIEAAADQLSHTEPAEFGRDQLATLDALRQRLRLIAKDKKPRYERAGHPPGSPPEVRLEKGRKAYELRTTGMMWPAIAEQLKETRTSPRGQLLIRGWAQWYATKHADPALPWPIGPRGRWKPKPALSELGADGQAKPAPTQPTPRRKLEWQGEYYSVSALARKHGLTSSQLSHRLQRNGGDLAQALGTTEDG